MRTGPNRSHGWILAALFLLALIPRLYHVNSRFLTDADHNTANWSIYAKNLVLRGWIPSRFGLVTNAYDPGGSKPSYFSHHPPTLGLLTSLVFLVFGVSEAAARFPALLASAATCPVLYLLFRRILGPPWALLAASIFATAPWPVYFGQMLNPEPFVTLLALLALLAWARFEESADRRWWRLSLGILAAASLTDWPGTYVAPALAAASFLSARTRARAPRLALQAFAVAAACAGLVFVHILWLKGSFQDLGRALSFRVLSSTDYSFTWMEYFQDVWRQLGLALTPAIRDLAVAGLALSAITRLRPAALSRGLSRGAAPPAALAAALVVRGGLHHVVFTNACYFNVHVTYYLVPTCLLLAAAVPWTIHRALRERRPRAAAAAAALVAVPFLVSFAIAAPPLLTGSFNHFVPLGWPLRGLALRRNVPSGSVVLTTGAAGSPQMRFYAWRRMRGERRDASSILGGDGDFLLRDRSARLPAEVESALAGLPRRPFGSADLYALRPGGRFAGDARIERPEPEWEMADARFLDRLQLDLHAHSPSAITIPRLPWLTRYLGVSWTPERAAGRIVHARFAWRRLGGRSDSLVPVYSLVSERLGEEIHAPVVEPRDPPETDLAGLREGEIAVQEADFFLGEWLPPGRYVLRAVVLEGDHLVNLEPPGTGPYAELGAVSLRYRD